MNVHLASQMTFVLNAHEARRQATGVVCGLLDFAGHMTSETAQSDWSDLHQHMRSVGVARGLPDAPLPHSRPSDWDSMCTRAPGSYHLSSLPVSLALELCRAQLLDYACLDFELPPQCVSLRLELERLRGEVERVGASAGSCEKQRRNVL